jgi:hypothetical protein
MAKKNTKKNFKLLKDIISAMSRQRRKEKEWKANEVNKGLTYFTAGEGESSREFMREKRAPRTVGDVIDFISATMFPENNPEENKQREEMTAFLQAEAWKDVNKKRGRADASETKKSKGICLKGDAKKEDKLLTDFALGTKGRIALEKALKRVKGSNGKAGEFDPTLASVLNSEAKTAPALANSKGVYCKGPSRLRPTPASPETTPFTLTLLSHLTCLTHITHARPYFCPLPSSQPAPSGPHHICLFLSIASRLDESITDSEQELTPQLVKYALGKSKALENAPTDASKASAHLTKKDRNALKMDLNVLLSSGFMMMNMEVAIKAIQGGAGEESSTNASKGFGARLIGKVKDVMLGEKVISETSEVVVDRDHDSVRSAFVKQVLGTIAARKHSGQQPTDKKKVTSSLFLPSPRTPDGPCTIPSFVYSHALR